MVSIAGTPRLNPEVFNVPTILVPAVVAVVNPVPAYVVAIDAVTLCEPLLDVINPKLTLLALENINRPTVTEVALSLTVHELFVTAGDVVRYAGTPMLNPEVFNVATIAVPAVVVDVKPVPALPDVKSLTYVVM